MGDIAGHFAPGNGCSDVTEESLLKLSGILSPPPSKSQSLYVEKKKKSSLTPDFGPNGQISTILISSKWDALKCTLLTERRVDYYTCSFPRSKDCTPPPSIPLKKQTETI